MTQLKDHRDLPISDIEAMIKPAKYCLSNSEFSTRITNRWLAWRRKKNQFRN